MTVDEFQPAIGRSKEPVSNDVYEQTREPSESRVQDDLEPSEFNVENIERIYR